MKVSWVSRPAETKSPSLSEEAFWDRPALLMKAHSPFKVPLQLSDVDSIDVVVWCAGSVLGTVICSGTVLYDV